MTELPPRALTPARFRALSRLFVETTAAISNTTGPGSIYWQTAEWLIDVGYATKPSATVIEITQAGQDRAVAEGINL